MYEAFSVLDVMLDEENPRFADPVDSQPGAINALLEAGRDKLLALMRDIAERGELDPTNPPIVMRTDDGVVVLEGNRRFAALKLLRNPDLAQATGTKRAILRVRKDAEELGREPDGPSEVACHVVSSREEARHWIELRHTGQNEGVGTDPWNSYQNNTFRRRPGSAEDRAWLVVREVIATFADDQPLVSDVKRVRDEKFTNLSRLLARENVRKAFSIDVRDDTVILQADSPFYVDILRTMFADLVDMTVDEIKTAAQQDSYAARVIDAVGQNHPELSEDLSGAASEDNKSDPGSGEVRGGETAGAGAGTQASAARPSGRDSSGAGSKRTRASRPVNKIFYGFAFRHMSARTSKLLAEAQKVRIDDAPSVCAVMVRVVVELAVTEVGVEQGWLKEGDSLRQKLRKALLQLDPNAEHSQKRDKELAMAWILTQSADGGGLAVDEMNAYVHNHWANPDGDRVRALCSNLRPLLMRLDAALEGEAAA